MRRSWRPEALVVAAAAAGLGCGEITDPYPAPLPPNLAIVSTPAHGAVVPVAEAEQVVLQFDRPMERSSVQQVQRLSFLLPLALQRFEGVWNATDTRVQFALSEFPPQPGATYEARFVGLRAASGTLYNGGPYDLRFRTRGAPDLFPMRPHPRVATRILCRRVGDGAPCTDATMHLVGAGPESLRVRSDCHGCDAPRRDWFRRHAGHVEWLGWDELTAEDVVVRRVRWPQPPRLLKAPSSPGTVLESGAQTAADGTQLVRWRTVHAGAESPAVTVDVAGRIVEVVYTASTTLDLDYALRAADGGLEQRQERWWLYPGVGLVRREVRVQRDGDPPSERIVETLVPSLVNFVN